MKWAVSIILALLTTLGLPAEFAAMGSPPTQAPETAQTSDARASEARTAEARTADARAAAENATASPGPVAGERARTADSEPAPAEPNEPPGEAQVEVQPVWRQGAQARPAQTRPPRNDARPAWRREEPSFPAGEQVQTPGAKGPDLLFRSKAFRGDFKALPKWTRVLSKVRGQIRTLNTCAPAQTCPPGATSWKRIMRQAKEVQGMEQLKMVNSFFNKWPYRLDQDAYGTSDWWATPQEFLKISGDCEDYAIIKYFALRELGFSKEDLRIVVLKDRIRNIPHAVLAVFLHGEALILNNLSDAIFTDVKYRHYIPQYSLNEEHRWSHIPVAN